MFVLGANPLVLFSSLDSEGKEEITHSGNLARFPTQIFREAWHKLGILLEYPVISEIGLPVFLEALQKSRCVGSRSHWQ